MIKVLDYTKNPLTLIGTCAKECWNSNPKDLSNTAMECINSAHGRVLEFADVTVSIEGYSARAIRELYTHIIGTTRLQASTRYIKYGEFDFFTPPSISKNESSDVYEGVMVAISDGYKKLIDNGVPKEDIANILPLGMVSKIVLKINARAIFHLAEMRLCSRAYHEMRKLTKELIDVIRSLDLEWNRLMDNAKVRCEVSGYCPEKNGCGRVKTRKQQELDKKEIDSIVKDLRYQFQNKTINNEDLYKLLSLLG